MNDRLGTADPKTALEDKHSIVITESLAKKYFGEEDPMGKTMSFRPLDLKVTGIIKDIPANSHMQFDYMFPIENMRRRWHENLESWDSVRFHTFIQLRKNTPGDELSRKISGIYGGRPGSLEAHVS